MNNLAPAGGPGWWLLLGFAGAAAAPFGGRGWRFVVAGGGCDGGWFGEVAVVGLVFDHFVDEWAVGVGVVEQVLQGSVFVVEGAGLVVADGDGLLVGEVGRDPAPESGVVDLSSVATRNGGNSSEVRSLV
ncbi:hypothetical protein ACWEIJ_45760 [Lentzea sp. NPDC004789]